MADATELNAKSSTGRRTFWVVAITTALSLVYAYVRYNVARDVAIDNFPLYISNKAIAMAATILIGISFVLGPLARFWPRFVRHLDLRKFLGLWGFGLAAVHAIISLIIISPAYYARLFDKAGKLTLQGESFLLFGVLAFLIFAVVAATSLPGADKSIPPEKWKTIQRLGYLAYVFVLFHVVILGYRGWSRPDSYEYGLASISLIAALFIVFVLLMRVLVMIFPRKK